jgi:hypothetical protein
MALSNNVFTRRHVLKGIGASAMITATGSGLYAAEYRRADASWFAACNFGISTHWTAQSKPVGADDWLPFEEAVARFSPEHYVDQIAGAGANYVIFTSAHALQMLPAPCTAIDRILPGRTTKRDLIGELANACHARGLHFILYYNHSCNHGDDPEWEYAVGYHAQDKSKLIGNLLGILRELGARYGSKVEAWWFDSCASLDPRDRYGWDRVTSNAREYEIPWEAWVGAAKTGFEERLVTLSAGMLRHYIYSTHQDYEAGEANEPVAVPAAQFTVDHLQGHRWVCIDNREWVHGKVATPLSAPIYREEQIEDYVRSCNKVKVPVTFNVDIDRTGLLSPESLTMLRNVKKNMA